MSDTEATKADRLAEIKATLDAGNEDDWWPLDEMYHLTPAQAAFYTDVPEAVAWLIAEVERLRLAESILREGLEHIRDAHLAQMAEELACPWCDTLNLPCWTYMEANGRLIAGRAEVEALRAALGHLVDLKDGPRDSMYLRLKPAAWDKAREALRRAAVVETETA